MNSRNILKLGPRGLADKLDLGYDRKATSRIAPMILTLVIRRMKLPSTEMGKLQLEQVLWGREGNIRKTVWAE